MSNLKKTCLWCFIFLFFPGVLTAESPVEKMLKMQEQIKTGYIDKTGKFVYEPQFDSGTDFYEGLATVHIGKAEQLKKRKTFLIDKDGTITPAPVASSKKVYTSSFDNDLWLIFSESKKAVAFHIYGFMNSNGKVLVAPQYEGMHFGGKSVFSEGLAAVRIDKKWGYVNEQLEIVINPQFDDAFNFSEGLAIVEKDGKKGYINKKGEIVIEPQFRYARDFSEGLAAVELNEKYGYINKLGDFVIKPQYVSAYSFSEGLARVCPSYDENNDKEVFINHEAQVVLQSNFDNAGDFHEGLAAVGVGSFTTKWGFMDKSGKVVIEPQFFCPEYSVDPPRFSEGLAAAGVKVNQYGYIDKTGKYIIPPILRSAWDFHEGIARVDTFPKELREFYFKEWLKDYEK